MNTTYVCAKKESWLDMLATLGLIFLALVVGIILLRIGISILSAIGGFIGIIVGIAALIGIVILIASFI